MVCLHELSGANWLNDTEEPGKGSRVHVNRYNHKVVFLSYIHEQLSEGHSHNREYLLKPGMDARTVLVRVML
jgi:hypothetical protein